MLYVNYISINLEKKFIKKRKKPISCIFGTHQKPRETHSSAASSSATQLGKKKACLLTGHIAKDVCFGSSCWGELHPPSPVPGGPGPCLYSLHPQEWFMRKSPRISSFPLIYSHSFTVCLQDHCWMQKVQDLKRCCPSPTGLFLPGRYCPGVQNQSGQEGTGCLRTSVATCIQVHRAPVPLQLPAIWICCPRASQVAREE